MVPNQDPTIGDQSFVIAGDASVGQVVGDVIASDADGTIASYAINGGSSVFAIDNTGQLTVIGEPASPSYNLTIDVTDNEGAPASATITVDVNAVAPALVSFTGIQINYSDEATAPPAGYLKDFGEAYGIRVGADQGSSTYNYGWIDVINGNPVSLVGPGP